MVVEHLGDYLHEVLEEKYITQPDRERRTQKRCSDSACSGRVGLTMGWTTWRHFASNCEKIQFSAPTCTPLSVPSSKQC